MPRIPGRGRGVILQDVVLEAGEGQRAVQQAAQEGVLLRGGNDAGGGGPGVLQEAHRGVGAAVGGGDTSTRAGGGATEHTQQTKTQINKKNPQI